MYLFIGILSNAQEGVIRGVVIDKVSEQPIPGVTIELLNGVTAIGTITNDNGKYRLENVPLGRNTIRINYLGFETITIPNIVVDAGKEAIANAALTESFDKLNEVILTSKRPNSQSINTLTSVSARQFGLEEVTRFSGGRSDVGRLAANYAGVSSPDDSRNDIVIRGNSPAGLLWRLEGVPIPNPNHFTSVGTTGGAVSAVNPNILRNSDFLTSAFPAEYGNALGGVFDLGFRKGNTDDYEFTAQVGAFTGVEILGEGPLGKIDGSFLISGRYSLVGLLGVGAGGTSATPNYSDLSFNIDLKKTALGRFSVFGIGGVSDIEFLGNDIDDDDLFAAEDEDLFVTSDFGVIGVKHQVLIGTNSYLKTILSGSLSQNKITADRFINLGTSQERTILFTETNNRETRLTFSTLFNSKLNNRITFRSGLLIENIGIVTLLRDREEQADADGDGDPDLFTFRDSDENLSIFQPYVQGQFRLTEKLKINIGVHGQYSSLNNQFVLEPRTGINYRLGETHQLSFGYGLHHQPVLLPILFLNEAINGELVQTNNDLDFVRSSHFVLGYDVRFGKQWRTKLEIYYQDINNAAVEASPSSYSSLTEGADFVIDNDRVSLVNEGTGFNQGIELTVEKSFSDGYYGLLTASLYESKYEGSDGIERNSPFNNGYVLNLLSGREFTIGKRLKDVVFFDTRLSLSGGRFFTPIDLVASQEAGFEVLREDIAFSEQLDGYLRWDLKLGIKINNVRKKRSHQFFVDIQNLTNRANVFTRRYNRLTNNVDEINQIGFFPDVGYRFQF